MMSLLQQGTAFILPNVGTLVCRNGAVAVLSDVEHADSDTIKEGAIQALTESFTARAGLYRGNKITLHKKTPKGFRVFVTIPSKWSKKKMVVNETWIREKSIGFVSKETVDEVAALRRSTRLNPHRFALPSTVICSISLEDINAVMEEEEEVIIEEPVIAAPAVEAASQNVEEEEEEQEQPEAAAAAAAAVGTTYVVGSQQPVNNNDVDDDEASSFGGDDNVGFAFDSDNNNSTTPFEGAANESAVSSTASTLLNNNNNSFDNNNNNIATSQKRDQSVSTAASVTPAASKPAVAESTQAIPDVNTTSSPTTPSAGRKRKRKCSDNMPSPKKIKLAALTKEGEVTDEDPTDSDADNGYASPNDYSCGVSLSDDELKEPIEPINDTTTPLNLNTEGALDLPKECDINDKTLRRKRRAPDDANKIHPSQRRKTNDSSAVPQPPPIIKPRRKRKAPDEASDVASHPSKKRKINDSSAVSRDPF